MYWIDPALSDFDTGSMTLVCYEDRLATKYDVFKVVKAYLTNDFLWTLAI
jgi:hypothetical protein